MNLRSLKEKSSALKKEIGVLYTAYQDPEMPLLPKILLWIALGYALSPIDLIPDFIPVLGYLDDLIILPLLIGLCIKSIPADVMARARENTEKKSPLPKPVLMPLIIVGIWLFLAGILLWIVLKAIKNI